VSRQVVRAALLVLAAGVTQACAARVYVPPAGAGEVEPTAAAIWQEVSAPCLAAREFVAEVSIRGWAGVERQGINSTLSGAATRDDSLYLELRFLGPVFQMAAHDGTGVFFLPRDQRVLRAPTRDIVDAMTGLRWGGRELIDVLTGCVAPVEGTATGVRVGGRLRIDLSPTAHVWLRERGRWRVEAAQVGGLLLDYRDAGDGRWPDRVRVTATTPVPLDLRFTVGQQQVNSGLPSSTFVLEVPPGTMPLTLEELRAMGPLRGRSSR
jgi:hypothetical protein